MLIPFFLHKYFEKNVVAKIRRTFEMKKNIPVAHYERYRYSSLYLSKIENINIQKIYYVVFYWKI